MKIKTDLQIRQSPDSMSTDACVCKYCGHNKPMCPYEKYIMGSYSCCTRETGHEDDHVFCGFSKFAHGRY